MQLVIAVQNVPDALIKPTIVKMAPNKSLTKKACASIAEVEHIDLVTLIAKPLH